MKQRAMGYAAVAVAMMLLIGATASAGEGGTWVSDKGHRVHVGGHDGMFFGEGANELQLEDLNDGETRVIGTGEKQVTVSRSGDEVTISRAEAGKSSALDMTCTIGRDSCKIITFEDDPARVMVVVEKTSICENGQGDCDDVDIIALGGGHGKHMVHKIHGDGNGHGEGAHVIRIKKTVECDDEGNCNDFEEVMGDDGGELSNVIIETLGNIDIGDIDIQGDHGNMVFITKGHHDGQVTLRCAEGDTTMQVEPKEADDVFLCPKHSTPLEKAESHPRIMRHKMRVKADSN